MFSFTKIYFLENLTDNSRAAQDALPSLVNIVNKLIPVY